MEINDRELLELAAKAAGIAFVYDDAAHCGYYGEWRGLPQWNAWNPLTDDGDALRLAVKLDMQIWRRTGGVVHGMFDGLNIFDRSLDEQINPDPYAATRRAIVRAAAEIAKGVAKS